MRNTVCGCIGEDCATKGCMSTRNAAAREVGLAGFAGDGFYNTNKKPYICPVCVGRGQAAISSDKLRIEFCKACHGACVLWG